MLVNVRGGTGAHAGAGPVGVPAGGTAGGAPGAQVHEAPHHIF